jgi:hypothetical protein
MQFHSSGTHAGFKVRMACSTDSVPAARIAAADYQKIAVLLFLDRRKVARFDGLTVAPGCAQ